MSTTATEPDTYVMPDKAIAALCIAQDREDYRAMGFQSVPLYEIGANAGSATSQGYMRRRMKSEEKPIATGPGGLPAAAAIIEREVRRDLDIKLQDVVMVDDSQGPILVTPGGDFRMESGVFDDLMGFLPTKQTTGWARSAMLIDRPLVAHAVNRLLQRAAERDRPLKLRTRIPEAGAVRGAYAIVSGGYNTYNIDRLALDLMRELDRRGVQGGRLDFTYDGSRATFLITWFNYHGAAGAKASGCGDVFEFGIRLTTADDRSASVKVELIAFDNLCLNYIIIGASTVDIGKLRHAGKYDMGKRIDSLIQKAMTHIEPMRARWEKANLDNLLTEFGVGTPETLYGALVKRGFGVVQGVPEATMAKRFTQALQNPAVGQPRWQGGAISTAHVIRALTQMAHTNRMPTAWAAQEIEEQAGQLLYARQFSVS